MAAYCTPAPGKWVFTENGRDFAVDVGARIVTNDPAFNLRVARTGVEVTLADDRVREELTREVLVSVLDEFVAPFPGFYLYYPQRRHASPGLRAFVEYLRRSRRS